MESDGRLPETVGNFRIIRHLATGGTSDVFLARPTGPNVSVAGDQEVVLKMLLPMYKQEPSFERMFHAEASAYQRLEHPAIVRLFEVFTARGQLVMVLEYVEGAPLNRLRALLHTTGTYLDDRACAYLAWCVFSALGAAHAARDPATGKTAPVVHRDINPSNVLIPWDGRVKLADFGIAKVIGVPGDTVTGLVKGTFGYMAPEQARGEVVTERADVYTATLLLWELLARRKAIQHGALPEQEVMRAMAYPQLPSLDVLRPDLPQTLRHAIARGLEVTAQKREMNADRMAGILKVFCPPEDGRRSLVSTLERVRAADKALGLVPASGSSPAVSAILNGSMRAREDSLPSFPLDADATDARLAPPAPPSPPVPPPAPAGARSMIASGVVNRAGGTPGAPPAAPRVPPPRPSASSSSMRASPPVKPPAAKTVVGGLQAVAEQVRAATVLGPSVSAAPVLEPVVTHTAPAPPPEATDAEAAKPKFAHTLAFSDLLLPRSAEPVGPTPAPLPSAPLPPLGSSSSDGDGASRPWLSRGAGATEPAPPPVVSSGPPAAPLIGQLPVIIGEPAADALDARPTEPAPSTAVAPVMVAPPGPVPTYGAASPFAATMLAGDAPPTLALADDSAPNPSIHRISIADESTSPSLASMKLKSSRASRLVWGIVGFVGTTGALAVAAFFFLRSQNLSKEMEVATPAVAVTAASTAAVTQLAPPSATPTPSPTPTPTASATASASPSPSASASAAPVSEDPHAGILVVESGAGSHRVFVDGKVVGQGGGNHSAPCGKHTVKIGSSGKAQELDIPCGGSVTVH